MKKQIIVRGSLGIFIGITLGYLITLFISLGYGHGTYIPCVPALVDQMGSQIDAVAVQILMCALLGFVFGASSVIWELDHWSLVKQTGIYFACTALAMFPIAYITHWMEHSLEGFLIYFAIFLAIFVVMWLIQYLFWKNRIKKINGKIQQKS